MSDPDEGFLSRWSRRKRDSDDASPKDGNARPTDETDSKKEWEILPQAEARVEAKPAESPPAESEEAAFDISKLPSIESITAETDIRAFLAPGVPPALTLAALRRAWVADPKIRDFIEMAENQWDFNAPGVPGFDLSPPTGDIKRMLADIMGRDPSDESPEKSASARPIEEQPRVAASSTVLESGNSELVMHREHKPDTSVAIPAQEPDSKKEAVQRTLIAHHNESDHALQQNDATQDVDRPIARRTHGSAMPR
jgi:hypothetical protein